MRCANTTLEPWSLRILCFILYQPLCQHLLPNSYACVFTPRRKGMWPCIARLAQPPYHGPAQAQHHGAHGHRAFALLAIPPQTACALRATATRSMGSA